MNTLCYQPQRNWYQHLKMTRNIVKASILRKTGRRRNGATFMSDGVKTGLKGTLKLFKGVWN